LFDELAVSKHVVGSNEGQVECVDRTPTVLGGFDKFECHGESGG